MRVPAAVMAVVLSWSAPALAQMPDLLPDRMRAHVEFLADDALEGRATGQRGYDLAALYVASQFRALGLTPGGTDEGSWIQPVNFLERTLVDGSVRFAWTGPDGRVVEQRQGEDIMLRAGKAAGETAIEAPAVFVGFGIEAPEHGMDDYAGLDVRGKVVVMFYGSPKGTPSELGAHLNSAKMQTASRKGAVGVIMVMTRQSAQAIPWALMRGYLTGPRMNWMDGDRPFDLTPNIRAEGYADWPAAATLFEGAPQSLDAVLDAANVDGGKPRGFPLNGTIRLGHVTETRVVESGNVIGVLPGSDPEMADEYVVLTAHLDHLEPGPDTAQDHIWNGAMDNASGVAAMIEAARGLVEGAERPRRSVMFIALTGEEKGLLGANHFAERPRVPVDRIAGLVNLDMPLLTYDFRDVVAFGAEHSTLGPIVARAAGELGLTLTPDPAPEQGTFTRSDHYELVKKGVPSVFLVTGPGGDGAAAWRRFQTTNYHQPSDDLSLPFDWNAAARFARVNTAVAREIADAPERPRWYGDSVFGSLFAAGQPKAERPSTE